jgi:uncharacterized protein (DUF488 family)
MIRIYTIGFTRTGAESFFGRLRTAGVRRVIDIRLNNTSQLAAFTKKDDLKYFLKEIADIEYLHKPDFAPTEEILSAYKKNNGDWNEYQRGFIELISRRKIEDKISPEILNDSCLLCSENEPSHCHRRLVAEYFKSKWSDVEIKHL